MEFELTNHVVHLKVTSYQLYVMLVLMLSGGLAWMGVFGYVVHLIINRLTNKVRRNFRGRADRIYPLRRIG